MKKPALFLVLSQLAVFSSAAGHGHHAHQSLHHSQRHENETASHVLSAEKLLEAGQRAMAHANQHIVANPRRNRLEVLNSTGLAEAQKPPPPLDYLNKNKTLKLHRRANKNATQDDGSEHDGRYTVPKELIKAAHLVSESWQAPVDGQGYEEYDAAVSRLKQEYKY
jgi:hypothetical protein